MITTENSRTKPLTGLGILKDLESFNINDIDEAIQELEDNIGKSYFGKGREFVRDGLMIELERLENGLTAFDLLSADDIHALSSEIGIDPETLYSGVAEIIAKRKSEVIE